MIFGFRGDGKQPSDPKKYLDVFLLVIPEYCVNEGRKLAGHPAEWQSQVISYSLYLGLGIFDLDKELGNKLIEGIPPGVRQTVDLVLIGLDEVKKTHHTKTGEKWNHVVSFLSNFMSLTSPETTGPTSDEELVKQRAPISGFIPALRLSVEDPQFAHELFRDAIHERQKCGAEELSARIDYMKAMVDEVMKRM